MATAPAPASGEVLPPDRKQRRKGLRINDADAGDQWMPHWRIFLDALARGYTITSACRLAQVHHKTAYEHKNGDEEFAEAWRTAYESGTDGFVDEAARRAVVGDDIPQFFKGQPILTPVDPKNPDGPKQVFVITQRSDFLLDRILRARRPQEFRDRVEHTGKDGGAIPIRMDNMTDEQIIALMKRIETMMQR